MLPNTLEELQRMSPAAFEQLIGRVFDAMGYVTTVTGRSGDGGVDLVLQKGDERSIAQCKRWRGQVGQAVIREFYGAVVHEKADRGYIVTTATFSLPALAWAQGKNLVLVDGVDLVRSIEGVGLDVPVAAASPSTASGDLHALGSALHAAKAGEAYLRLAFIGPPPTTGGYRPFALPIAYALGIRVARVLSSLSEGQMNAILASMLPNSLLFVEELEAAGEALVLKLIRLLTWPEMMWGQRVSLESRHVIFTVWEPKRLDRLPLRTRLEFAEAFPLQVHSEVVDWHDPAQWVVRAAMSAGQSGAD